MELTPFGELLKNSWELYKRKLTVLVTLMALPFVLNVLLSLSQPKRSTNLSASPYTSTHLPAMGGITLLVLIAFIVVALLIQVATIKVIDSSEDNPDLGKLLSSSSPVILPYVWVAILIGLAVFGGLILFIIPGIIFAFWFSFAPYEVVLDQKRGVEALKASKALVSGRVGAIVGRFLLLILVFIGISIIVTMVTVFLPGVLRDMLSAAASSFLTTPLGTIFVVLLYKELKAKPVAAPAPAAPAA